MEAAPALRVDGPEHWYLVLAVQLGWFVEPSPTACDHLVDRSFGILPDGETLSAEDDPSYFKRLVSDCFKATVVVEFLIVGHSFSLPVELLFVPFMALLAMLIGISQTNAEHPSVTSFLEWLAITIAAALLWKAVVGIWDQPSAFLTTQTGRNFLLPGLLTMASIPFLYAWYCYSQLESASIQIDVRSFQSDELKRYAKGRFFIRFMCRPLLLRRAVRQFHGLFAETKNDVDRIVSDVLTHERLRKNPPVIDESLGWSPYLAREFLRQEGFETSDYHRAHTAGRWWADSNRVDLDGPATRNAADFFVEGTEEL